MSLFISDAFAAAGDAATSTQLAPYTTMMLMAGVMAIAYFLLIRPQNKRMKEHKDLVAGLQSGDEVITNGGIVGKISEIDESFIHVTVAEGVVITLQKNAVSAALPKGTLKSS